MVLTPLFKALGKNIEFRFLFQIFQDPYFAQAYNLDPTFFALIGFWVSSTQGAYLVWANGRCLGCWGSPHYASVVTVNWWFVHAAGPHTIYYIFIKPVACIFTVYCLNIPEAASFTAVWSKHWECMLQRCICATFDGKYSAIVEWKDVK